MILTNDQKCAELAHYLTTQAKDDPLRYIHNDIGYNFRLTNIQAALGVAQLEKIDEYVANKVNIHNMYKNSFKRVDGLSLAEVPNYASNNHWMNVLKINNDIFKETNEELMMRLNNEGIQTRPVWAPCHLQKPYYKFQSYKIENTNELVKTSLCIPSGTNLSNSEQQYVINTIIGK